MWVWQQRPLGGKGSYQSHSNPLIRWTAFHQASVHALQPGILKWYLELSPGTFPKLRILNPSPDCWWDFQQLSHWGSPFVEKIDIHSGIKNVFFTHKALNAIQINIFSEFINGRKMERRVCFRQVIRLPTSSCNYERITTSLHMGAHGC